VAAGFGGRSRILESKPVMLKTKRVQSPDIEEKTFSKVSSEALDIPDLHITILSFTAPVPPLSAKSISNARWHRVPFQDACGLFLRAKGRNKAISLCSYIEDEKTRVLETSSVNISAGPACQLLQTDEFPGRFCANLAFSVACLLREFLKQRFDMIYQERVLFRLYFSSRFQIRLDAGYTPSGHRTHELMFCLTTNRIRTMSFIGEYDEASPTEEGVKREQMQQGVPDDYPQTYKQRKRANSDLPLSDLLGIFQSYCASGYTLTTDHFRLTKYHLAQYGKESVYVFSDPIQLCLKALKKSSPHPAAAVAKSWHRVAVAS
jgi:hypothetical protein